MGDVNDFGSLTYRVPGRAGTGRPMGRLLPWRLDVSMTTADDAAPQAVRGELGFGVWGNTYFAVI